jgi:hypothetical protein
MRKILLPIVMLGFATMSVHAEDYVYLKKEPSQTVSYPGYSDSTDLVLSGRASGIYLSDAEVCFSGVSRMESNTSGLDASKPIGMYMILR